MNGGWGGGTETHGPELSSSLSCVLIQRAEVTSQENKRGAKKPCVLSGVVSDQVLTTDLSHLGWSLHAVFTKLLLGTLGDFCVPFCLHLF